MIMIRNPVAGKVKKRLAATLGPEKALAIYQTMMSHTRGVALQIQAERYVFYSEFIEAHDEWNERFFSKRIQSGADLGQRMCQALTSLQSQHQKMVLIGSDIPGLSPGLLADAFARLHGLRYEELSLTADDQRVFMEYRRINPGDAEMLVAEVLEVRDGCIVASRVYHG